MAQLSGTAVYQGAKLYEGLNDDSGGQNTSYSKKNTNPYDGPVDEDVMLVDPNGNVIPVKAGEQAQGSPDGRYIQVEDNNRKPTGLRKDGPHNPS